MHAWKLTTKAIEEWVTSIPNTENVKKDQREDQ
jgi:hypothetical protein